MSNAGWFDVFIVLGCDKIHTLNSCGSHIWTRIIFKKIFKDDNNSKKNPFF